MAVVVVVVVVVVAVVVVVVVVVAVVVAVAVVEVVAEVVAVEAEAPPSGQSPSSMMGCSCSDRRTNMPPRACASTHSLGIETLPPSPTPKSSSGRGLSNRLNLPTRSVALRVDSSQYNFSSEVSDMQMPMFLTIRSCRDVSASRLTASSNEQLDRPPLVAARVDAGDDVSPALHSKLISSIESP
jgi:hypothetical protein